MKLQAVLAPTLFFTLLARAAAATDAQDSTQAAKELVQRGSAEYAKQHWEAARVAFLQAWEVKEHYAIAGSLADVEMKLGRYRDAAEHLKYAIANLPPDHPEKRADAEADLKECRTHLSAVRVLSGGLLVLVKLDNQVLAHEDLRDEILLDPGPHRLEAQQRGYVTAAREFTAIAGETREIRLNLVPLALAPSVGPDNATRPGSSEPRARAPDNSSATHYSPRTWALIGGSAATVIAAGVGTYFTLRYFALKRDAETTLAQVQAEGSPELAARHTECQPGAPMRPAACDQLSETLDSRTTAAQISNVSFVTAGALGVATLVTYLLWPIAPDGRVEKQARVSITPWLQGVHGGALQVNF